MGTEKTLLVAAGSLAIVAAASLSVMVSGLTSPQAETRSPPDGWEISASSGTPTIYSTRPQPGVVCFSTLRGISPGIQCLEVTP